MSRWRRWPVLIAVGVLACAQDVLTRLTPEERNVIRRYLDCIDCVTLLDSVRALASRKPEETVDSLNQGLLLGPVQEAIAAAESVLTLGYVRDSTWRVANNQRAWLDRPTYVTQSRDRFVNGYRARGAYGMGWIHTPRAVAYLDSAAKLQLPASVRRAVLYARDSLPPQQVR